MTIGAVFESTAARSRLPERNADTLSNAVKTPTEPATRDHLCSATMGLPWVTFAASVASDIPELAQNLGSIGRVVGVRAPAAVARTASEKPLSTYTSASRGASVLIDAGGRVWMRGVVGRAPRPRRTARRLEQQRVAERAERQRSARPLAHRARQNRAGRPRVDVRGPMAVSALSAGTVGSAPRSTSMLIIA